MHKRALLAAAAVAVIVVAVGLLVWPGHLLSRSAPTAAPTVPAGTTSGSGRPVPAAAAAVVRQLVTGDGRAQRAALDPVLAGALPQGEMFPSGSGVVLDARGWRQAGQYANVTGTLTEPGVAPTRVEIGFDDTSGSWLVTFEQALS
jgi:hypothetical protein